MKRLSFYIISLFIVMGCSLDREPQSDISTESFFKNEDDLKMYTYNFYDILPTSISTADTQSDNIEGSDVNLVVRGKHVEPSSGDGWDWGYLRKVNYFLVNISKADVTDEVGKHYEATGRFFRAWFYSDKVKRYGDVPWYSVPLPANDPELYKARDSRITVMDNVLQDLEFACQHMNETNSDGAVNKWVAYALKARVCLREGTFRKYHNISGGEKFLEEAHKAALAVINSGKYKLYSTGSPYSDFGNLFAMDNYNKDEVLLARRWDKALHASVGHTSNSAALVSTQGRPGATKSLVNTFLMKDGTPFTSKPGYKTMMLEEECEDRDPRLSQTIRTPGYMRYGETQIEKPFIFFGATATGYQMAKHITGKAMDGWQGNFNDVPVFRYAEVLLNYAEAKAELGILANADLEISINKIRERVDMPKMPINVAVDPVLDAQYPNVSSSQKALVLEIRRERRVELALEGFRYDDLMRWKCGKLLIEQFTGMYFPAKGAYDMDGDGTIDVELVDKVPSPALTDREYVELKASGPLLSEGDKGYLIMHPLTVEGKSKEFDENKHYLFPLPLDQFVLNPALEQNPGWRKQ